ncbi:MULTISPECIES: DUF58 domain-containing protein [unclassified Dyella]|uniref:DUF58 domain-containing protein n=1 Tax=unclassified Dyella TaxID=2634549 RepID=UPI000C850099|nr:MULTISPECIES: DUF58 domain-containing protein [unclassified Dyella]MDR3445073.1 DUF58 domain-containing protein [Dyella sp.]PMQ04970.1 hypothetical protein DyAD56_11465 [Dyella sp. AD56]
MTTVEASDVGTVYVTPAHLARMEYDARRLRATPHRPHHSVLAGRHASRLRGRGLNFEEIRAYVPGDDVRHLDWKVSLRVGHAMVRSYTEERDRPALFVVDQRMSMFYGTRRAMKSVVAAEVAALGAWMAFQAGDRAGAVVFDDSEIHSLRARRSRSSLQAVLGALARSNQALRADSSTRINPAQLNGALRAALHLATHDYLVFIVSDFLGADEETLQLIRELATHNDVIAALVFDPSARAVPDSGKIVVTEGELQVELDFGRKTIREPLSAMFEQRLQQTVELVQRCGVPTLAIDTEQPTLLQMARLLGHFAQMRG